MNAEVLTAATTTQARGVNPIQWLLRRELWEHRALLATPAILIALIVAGAIIGLISGNTHGLLHFEMLNEQTSRTLVTTSNLGVASLFAVVMPVVWMFYCMDALNAERRDRSILFWKSLPVSDLQTVLSKVVTVTVVAPLIAFAAILVAQLLMLLIATVVLAANGYSSWRLWAQPAFLSTSIAIAYSLLVISLWYLPVYAWLLLVSAWARRSTMLWTVLPPVAIIIIEKISFGTAYFLHMLGSRLGAGIGIAFNPSGWRFHQGMDFNEGASDVAATILSALDPYHLLSSVELWIGLSVAAALIAITIWLRRYREPF